jgi:hypothetical protein
MRGSSRSRSTRIEKAVSPWIYHSIVDELENLAFKKMISREMKGERDGELTIARIVLR